MEKIDGFFETALLRLIDCAEILGHEDDKKAAAIMSAFYEYSRIDYEAGKTIEYKTKEN